MKKALFMVALMVAPMVNAQHYIDRFDTNELGWTELAGDDGEAVIKEGVMHIDGGKSVSFFGLSVNIPSFVETHCYAPLDVTKDFEINCEAFVKKIGGISRFGIIIDYLDEGNFVLFSISEGKATMFRYKDYNMVGRIRQDIKLKSQKDATIKLSLKSTLNKIEFYVNDMKALECRYLNLISNGIGFYVYSKQSVDFDNLEIIQ